MPSLLVLALVGLTALVVLAAFVVYLMVRYAPIVGRIFEETPLFMPLRVAPEAGGEEVRFATREGLELRGTYYRARSTSPRLGVIVFCHEFLGDRWSFRPYADPLRDEGFDVFAFDFRNHGASASEEGYQPLQWVSNREVRDLRAALAYLRSRPDRDAAGFGLYGISRGGSTALCVAGKDPGIWGVVTDGAFPTRGTMAAYIQRWAQIYIGGRFYANLIPGWIFALVSWAGRLRSQYRRGCRFPDVERAVGRLGPRPWLMIHGEKDAYITAEIARRLFAEARGGAKELWIVPEAKHNRCREVAPEAYRERVGGYFRRYGPRRPIPAAVSPAVGQPVAAPITTPVSR